MSQPSVIHDTFTIERSYPVTTSRVFAAFASQEAKGVWGDTGDLTPGDLTPGDTTPGDSATAASAEFDFRVGGHERFGFGYDGHAYRYDALYYDIVPEQRIIYSYEMFADGARISVSVATIEFTKAGDGTALTWTEQGTYLDGFDGAEASDLRRGGTAEMLDGLAKYLA